ncbi:MAG: type II secretion system GspH family protein [Fusobacterium sp.]|nr:type II secretion system GspH family protein [Fusobacterium sp.]
MAEILLSLTIIGVVAAITLPSLTGNINERTWNTQRKALYARFSQAIALMPALNGYGVDNPDTAAETFVTAGLSKVLKINNICDSEHLTDCGLPAKFIGQTGSVLYSGSFPNNYRDFNPTAVALSYDNGVNYAESYSQVNTKAAAFETANGESIAVYYNPSCKASMNENKYYLTPPKVCVNFVYDLNGSKGPNTIGKDMGFMTVLYPTDSVIVAPLPANAAGESALFEDAAKVCRKLGDEYRMPNRDEMVAMFINKNLIDIESGYYHTSTLVSAGNPWNFIFHTAVLAPANDTAGASEGKVKCIHRY